MILLRFIMVRSRADNVRMKVVKIVSLIIGSLATLFLSFVANFPEQQTHGVGLTHVVSAGILFTGGCAFIVIDALILLRMRVIEVRNDVTGDMSLQHWLRSLGWLHWLRLVVSLLSVLALVLCECIAKCFCGIFFLTAAVKAVRLKNTHKSITYA